MTRTVKTCLVTRVLVRAVACSDDDGGGGGIGGGIGGGEVSEEAKPYVESLSKNLNKSDEGQFDLDDEQSNCIAPRWVNTLKPDRLEKAGIKPADLGSDDNAERFVALKLSEDEGGALVDAFSDCGVNLREAFFGGDTSLTDEDRTCLDGAINDDLLKGLLILGFTKGPSALSEDSGPGKEFNEAIAKCPGASD